MTPTVTVQNVRNETVALEADYALQAGREAENHITRVWAHFHAEEEAVDDKALAALGNNPAIGAFDGCTTCEVREMLHAAVPFLEAGFRREYEAEVGTDVTRPLIFTLQDCPNRQTPAHQE